MNNSTNILEEKSGYVLVTLDIIRITNLTLSILLNTLSFLLLKHLRIRILSNQQLILMSMNLLYICISLTDILYIVAKVAEQNEYTVDILISCHRIITSLFFTFYGVIFILTLDRLLAFLLHIKYRSIVTAQRTLFCLLAALISGVISALTFGILNISNDEYKYVYLSLDIILLFEFIITYTYIIIMTSKKRRIGSSNAMRARGKIFYVTTLIIATFVVFVVVPDMLNAFIFLVTELDRDTMANIVGLFWSINFVIDPCLYIFSRDDVRNVLRQIFEKRYCDCHGKIGNDAHRRSNTENLQIHHFENRGKRTMTYKIRENML